MENNTLSNVSNVAGKVAKKAAGSLLKSLIMFVILIIEFAFISLIIYKMFPDVKGALVIGIGFNIIYMFFAFFVKKIRTIAVIWFGICSLGLTIWWIYLFLKIGSM